MIKYVIPFFFLIACTNEAKESIQKEKTVEKTTIETSREARSKYSYKVVFEEGKGWGYQIFEGSHMLINQMHIPAIQGLQSFSSEKNARTTAEYILNQVELGHFPPTVTVDILDSLNVLNN